ncbi:hypothetical protein EV193_103446 [Herbihabitans rhizosphaerae]|uniref:Outer membrane channel protein CpnT-like N-terminal domain-containing protein n=1 Tax=Herbihabitans rhizosphaerae TaxID=1872711 RepID=A0A4Q7KWS2_9PSEU|nr:hypothetical protein [Herbihabitans rhizosphaerae]RZS41127.1 hypothetical protein EV193_103446 [Herbihabitans rhizosphaerae]
MTLNTEVKGEPEELRKTARWLREAKKSVHATGTQVGKARTESETEWAGKTGEGFRTRMGEARGRIDDLSSNAGKVATALDDHAEALDSVKSKMRKARTIASEGGLTVTATSIEPPGPAPAAPTPLPKDKEPTPAQTKAHDAATSAQSAHLKQVAAYKNAEKEVKKAESKLDKSVQFFKDESKKWWFWSDLFSGGVALGVESASKFNKQTGKFKDRAKIARQHAARARAQGKSDIAKRYSRLAQQRAAAGRTNINARDSNFFRKYANKMPGWAKGAVTADMGKLVRGGGRFARAARPVLSKVPVLGLGLTAVGVGMDIKEGKGVAKSVVAGGGSLMAGAAVGTAIGGPVGFVAGAAVGLGVGYAMDMGLADKIVDGGEAIGEGAKKVGGAIGDGAKKVGGAIGGLFD